jgi:hypothetical protein
MTVVSKLGPFAGMTQHGRDTFEDLTDEFRQGTQGLLRGAMVAQGEDQPSSVTLFRSGRDYLVSWRRATRFHWPLQLFDMLVFAMFCSNTYHLGKFGMEVASLVVPEGATTLRHRGMTALPACLWALAVLCGFLAVINGLFLFFSLVRGYRSSGERWIKDMASAQWIVGTKAIYISEGYDHRRDRFRGVRTVFLDAIGTVTTKTVKGSETLVIHGRDGGMIAEFRSPEAAGHAETSALVDLVRTRAALQRQQVAA